MLRGCTLNILIIYIQILVITWINLCLYYALFTVNIIKVDIKKSSNSDNSRSSSKSDNSSSSSSNSENSSSSSKSDDSNSSSTSETSKHFQLHYKNGPGAIFVIILTCVWYGVGSSSDHVFLS